MINEDRRNARRYALQALYQWSFCKVKSNELISQFLEDYELLKTDVSYFKELITGTIQNVVLIDRLMTVYLDRKISALDPVELSVLRISIYELLYRKEVPYKVAIDEGLKLVKEFGAEAGYKYVNAILDVLSSAMRK